MEKSKHKKYCQECGRSILWNAEYCIYCGYRTIPLIINSNSRMIAFLLAIFLGGLGIHKFYLGQIGWGIIYLLFCWTFIPGFIALFEGCIYLMMSDEIFHQKYMSKEYI